MVEAVMERPDEVEDAEAQGAEVEEAGEAGGDDAGEEAGDGE